MGLAAALAAARRAARGQRRACPERAAARPRQTGKFTSRRRSGSKTRGDRKRGENRCGSAVQVITLARLHDHILLFARKAQLVITLFGVGVRRVTETVLAAQFLFDLA